MEDCAATISRRSVLLALLVAGGCGLTRETEVLVGLVGDYRVSLDSLADRTYVPEISSWVVRVPDDVVSRLLDSRDATLMAAAETGFLVLYQKCPHRGCRVPECADSGFFECPCCGSKFTRYGERVQGPAPRGLDRLRASVDGADLVINRADLIRGLPVGVHPSGEEAAGPLCVGSLPDQ